MKKLFLSLTVFAASAAYVVYQNIGSGTAPIPTAQTSAIAIITPVAQQPADQEVVTTPASPTTQPYRPSPPTTPTPASMPVPTPALAPKPKGQYTDGTYTGSGADAYYGTVQVQATIQGGKLIDVSFLQYPNDRRTSQYINSQAMPRLRQEAIQAQSASVSGVSGASDTSAAFRESLANALAQAKS